MVIPPHYQWLADNGKAYAANATLPAGVSLVGVIVKSGVVMKSQNQGAMYNRTNAQEYGKHTNAETGDSYYINNTSETTKTQKNWIIGSKSEYQGILGNAGANINSIQTLLSAAGADPLTTGDLGYVTWCYEEDNYFKINAVGTSNFVSYSAWNTDASTGRYARLIFFY